MSDDADDMLDVLDVREAAKLLRIHTDTLYNIVNRNEIPHRRLGRAIRFSRAALMRWLEDAGWRSSKGTYAG